MTDVLYDFIFIFVTFFVLLLNISFIVYFIFISYKGD